MWFPSPFAQARSSFEEPVTPPDVDPDAGGLISVSFNPAWLPYVLGALTQLQQPSTWDGDDAAKQLAISRAILLSNLVGYPLISVPGTEPGTPPPVTRYNPDCDCVQTSTDGGVTWDDAPGADPRNQSPLSPQTGINASCNSAASLRKYLVRFTGVLQGVGGAGVTATGLGYSIIGVLIELSGPWAIIADVAVAASLGFIAAGLSAINDAFSDTNLDAIECILYCELNGNTQLNATSLGAVEDQIDSQIGGTSATIIKAVLNLMGFGGINSAMALKLDTDDCSSCGCDWCHTFDFTVDNGGWTVVPPGGWAGGQYGAGGWTTTDKSTGTERDRDFYIQHSLSSTVVTSVELTYSYSNGNHDTGAGIYNLLDNTGSIQSVNEPGSMPSSPHTWTGSRTMTNLQIFIAPTRCNNSCGLAGSATLSQVTVCGNGSDPF